MILILTRNIDSDSMKVCEWLLYSNESYYRINLNSGIQIKEIMIEDCDRVNVEIIVENKLLDLKELKSFWYKKGDFKIEFSNLYEKHQVSEINFFLSYESHIINNFIMILFQKIKSLGNHQQDFNKLFALSVASQCDISIPKTVITSYKDILVKFKTIADNIISKSIHDSFNLLRNQTHYFGLTQIVSEEIFHNLPQTFFPSLVQERLDKKYELRIFFMHEAYYPMAIFSQMDEKTQTDFRHYNKEKPNRTVPFKLPEDILTKLKKLMKALGLNTGSIDMVVTKDNRYVFLEVNPTGQFGMVSYPCNYFLEKKIAEFLSTDENERTQ